MLNRSTIISVHFLISAGVFILFTSSRVNCPAAIGNYSLKMFDKAVYETLLIGDLVDVSHNEISKVAWDSSFRDSIYGKSLQLADFGYHIRKRLACLECSGEHLCVTVERS
jgi:hypothetical protein